VTNIASMQEMAPKTVRDYFDFLRRNVDTENLFYCCNRVRKEMPGGEVSDFASYSWSETDTDLIDGVCPWHRYYLAPHNSARGPRVLGLRIPFVNYFDGDHVHRLTRLAVEPELEG